MKRSVLPDKPASLLFNNQKIKVHVVDKTFEPEAAHPTPGTADFSLTTPRPSDEIQGHYVQASQSSRDQWLDRAKSRSDVNAPGSSGTRVY